MTSVNWRKRNIIFISVFAGLVAGSIGMPAQAVMRPDLCAELLAPMGIAPNHLATQAPSVERIFEAKQNIEPAMFVLPASLSEKHDSIGSTDDAVRFLDDVAESLLAQLPKDVRLSIRELYQNDIHASDIAMNAYKGIHRYNSDILYGQVVAVDQNNFKIHWDDRLNQMPIVSRIFKIRGLILDLGLQRQLLWLDDSGGRYRELYRTLNLHIMANSFFVIMDVLSQVPFNLILKELMSPASGLTDPERAVLERYLKGTQKTEGSPRIVYSRPDAQDAISLDKYLYGIGSAYRAFKIIKKEPPLPKSERRLH